MLLTFQKGPATPSHSMLHKHVAENSSSLLEYDLKQTKPMQILNGRNVRLAPLFKGGEGRLCAISKLTKGWAEC